jgi:hypothetical protein
LVKKVNVVDSRQSYVDCKKIKKQMAAKKKAKAAAKKKKK